MERTFKERFIKLIEEDPDESFRIMVTSFKDDILEYLEDEYTIVESKCVLQLEGRLNDVQLIDKLEETLENKTSFEVLNYLEQWH